jgi:hypothetical protein
MIHNSLIIIPFHTDWDCSSDYLKQTSLVLAKNRNVVIAYLAIRELSIIKLLVQFLRNRTITKIFQKRYGVIFYSPILFFPFSRIRHIYLLNTFISVFLLKLYISFHSLYRKKNILWIFHPSYSILPQLFGSRFSSFYDCVDFHSSLHINVEKNIRQREKHLISHCDYMTVNSHILYDKNKHLRKDIQIVPQGFSLNVFRLKKKINNEDLNIIKKKKVVGYIGWLNFRIDFDLLLSLVKKLKDYNFLLIGSQQFEDMGESYLEVRGRIKNLLQRDNILWLENQPKENIPYLVNLFDVGMIPYAVQLTFNKFCYPMKLFEYFYMGKPVIATPIEELKRYPKFVKIGNAAEEWEKIIKKLLNKPWPKKYQQEQRKLAIANSWENKIKAISNVIEQSYEPKPA